MQRKYIFSFCNSIFSYARRHKRILLKHSVYAALLIFCAMAIVGFRVLYPYHFLFSLPFLVVGIAHILFLPFHENAALQRSHTMTFIRKVLKKYALSICVGTSILLVLYIYAQTFPNDKNPFAGMSDDEIVRVVDESLDISVLYLDQLEITGHALLESGLLDNETLTADELTELQVSWNEFIHATRVSEEVTEIHRYFGKISYWSLPEAHTKSFVISYGLYLKKFELFGRIIQATDNNERVIKALNENSEAFGGKNSFYDVRERHIGNETLLRRTLGRAYLWFLLHTVPTEHFGENFNAFIREGKESYSYLISNSLTTVGIAFATQSDAVENGLFNSWFPIQKSVADTMGKIHVSSRKEPLISYDDVARMREELHPGDILIERRNWNLSNVGIPGFWPHAALHLGTLEEADVFFADLFPRDGFTSYDELVHARYPQLYSLYQGTDEKGYPYAVIEGQAPGIILQSLEKSAMADYVGVLRPQLEKENVLKALLRAMENYGKPYDYNFDFETRDEIVCSELVYDAYLPGKDKEGINFELTRTSGRNMISPNDMVEKFYREYGTPKQELDFVYFIDGNESLQKSFVKDENAFLTTWTRSKFSNLQE